MQLGDAGGAGIARYRTLSNGVTITSVPAPSRAPAQQHGSHATAGLVAEDEAGAVHSTTRSRPVMETLVTRRGVASRVTSERRRIPGDDVDGSPASIVWDVSVQLVSPPQGPQHRAERAACGEIGVARCPRV